MPIQMIALLFMGCEVLSVYHGPSAILFLMEKQDRSYLLRNIAIIVLFLFCFFEVRSIVVDLHEKHESGDFYRRGRVVRSVDLSTPDEIQPWMTFHYINFVFKLPDSYLSSTLGLAGDQYPNIQITRYARLYQLDLTELMTQIKDAVRQQQAQH